MKDYYAILRLPRTANASEVKASYRTLVQQFHPDVNPDPAAHELIKEINEAYEVLGDDNKKRGYDFILNNPHATIILEQQPKPHRDPAYHRKRNYQPGPSDESILQAFMQKWLPLTVWIAWAGCAMCTILMLDFVLPHQVTPAQVKSFRNGELPRGQSSYIITASGKQLKISNNDWAMFQLDQPIEIVESAIFSILIEIKIPVLHKSITNLSTVYRNYAFVPLLLVATSLLGLFVKNGVEFRFNLGIVNIFILIFTLIATFK